MGNINDMDIPKSPSNYLKLEEGTVKVRILNANFIEGYIDWADKKPIYYEKDQCPETSISPDGFVYFRSCVIWNYDEKKLQAWEIKSKQIMNKIKGLSADEDRGPDLDYDLKVTKTGLKKETKYDVIPAGKGETKPEILEAYKEADITLEQCFEGIDPMKKKE